MQSLHTIQIFLIYSIIYKLVTKVIVNRLKHILPQLISPTQCSFVPGRQITDNVIIVQEMLHTMRSKQGRKGFMAIKIDFEKAYDRLRWAFIRDSLLELCLPQLMVDLIMNCITSAKLQVLWNGEPTPQFSPSRGIRQGDPLSPYLYVICMERLAHLIDKEVRSGGWKPVRASRHGPPISNLAFADDLILFSEASVAQAEVIMNCLDKFCQASGSKVSRSKSQIFFSNNTSYDIRDAVSGTLNMEITDDLGRYLGVPTINGRSSKQEYQYLVDRINDKLAGWKTKTLSMAGRATLIQSSLSTIPCYTMQTTKLPRSTCDEIDRKSRKFLWGEIDSRRRMHMVAWENVTKPKKAGGLGIRSMRQTNSAFLAKLGWRLLTEPNALWARILRSKYCEDRCDIDMFKEKANCSNAWHGIMSSIDIVRKGLSMTVGNGERTFFWHHRWATSTPLIDMANPKPPLSAQDKTVKELWDPNVGWKLEEFAEFIPPKVVQEVLAHELVEDEDTVDEVYWNGSPSGGFSITSAMEIVRNDVHCEVTDKSWQMLWKIPAPQRVRMFLWLAFQDRLMTNANRFLRNLTEDPRCYVCGEVEENSEHIIRDCPAARVVWSKITSNDQGGSRVSFRDWIIDNIGKQAAVKGDEWPTVFAMTCWWLWRWRNERSFERTPSIPVDQVSFISARVGTVKRALDRWREVDGQSIKPRQEIKISWSHPREGWVMLNTDGASKGNSGVAGAGGLIRSHRGEVFEIFAMNCGICSCMRAELLAVQRGLSIAWNGGYRKVQVRIDSESVMRLLQGEAIRNSPYIHIIKKCKALIARVEWEVEVAHCYREANRAADWLANFGVTSKEKLVIFTAVPKDLSAVLLEDLSGVAWRRMVPSAAEDSAWNQ